MADKIMVSAETRTESGSGAAGRMRRAGFVPAVVNEPGQDAQLIKLHGHEFEQTLRHHASESILMDVTIDGGVTRTLLLKDVQHDPVSGAILHADFAVVDMTQKITVTIPIEPIGESAGVLVGGVLEQPLHELEVECLPGDLVESLSVDVSALNIGDSLTVADLSVPEGYDVVTPSDVGVVSVAAPRLEEEPEEAEGEEGAEGGEPAVIGEESDEESSED